MYPVIGDVIVKPVVNLSNFFPVRGKKMKMHPLSNLFQFLRNLLVLYAPCIIFGRNGQGIIITVSGGLMTVGEGITTVLKP